MRAGEQHVIDLLDYAMTNLGGFTVDDVMADFGWNHQTTNTAIRDLRMFLGKFDKINLPCDPQGHGQRWLYRLVGNLDGVRAWAVNRLGDTETRLRTQQAMMASIVSALDGRSVHGKVARTVDKALRRLIEDIDDIVLNGQQP